MGLSSLASAQQVTQLLYEHLPSFSCRVSDAVSAPSSDEDAADAVVQRVRHLLALPEHDPLHPDGQQPSPLVASLGEMVVAVEGQLAEWESLVRHNCGQL